MRALIAVLAVVSLLLMYLCYSQLQTIHQLQAANGAITVKLTDKLEHELDAKKLACSDRAQAVFRSMGYSDKGDPGKSGADSQSYTNHYNPALNRCIMELTVTGFPSTNEVVTRTIFDADERTDFGDYAWVSSNTKKFYEQKPMQCKMTPPSKDEAYCHSTDEWEAYVKSLMS